MLICIICNDFYKTYYNIFAKCIMNAGHYYPCNYMETLNIHKNNIAGHHLLKISEASGK